MYIFHMAQSGQTLATHPDPRADGALVTKAVLRAAGRLELSNKELARILGLSESTLSRMAAGSYVLAPEQKPYELALLLVRLYRSLDSIVGGDAAAARAWLRAENRALGAVPLSHIMSIAGLAETIAYLDARRAPV
jgi:transcriptional regulator with XRE-family HTH domain